MIQSRSTLFNPLWFFSHEEDMGLDPAILKDMLENAVYQQLFLGNNRIQGKNPEYTMQFTGSGELLAKFIEKLKESINLVVDQKPTQFIEIFEKTFRVDLSEAKERSEINLMAMGDLTGQEITAIYIVLAKLIEDLREQAYKKWGRLRIEENYEKLVGKKFGDDEAERVQHLSATNDPAISLLYNLSFLALLAEAFGEKNMIVTAKRLVSTKINSIVKRIAV
jgi:hypothetical protein